MNTILKLSMKMNFIIILMAYCKLYKEKIKSDKEEKIKNHYHFLKIKLKL